VGLGSRVDRTSRAERSEIERYVMQRRGEGVLIVKPGQPMLANCSLDSAADLCAIHPLGMTTAAPTTEVVRMPDVSQPALPNTMVEGVSR